MKRDDEQASLDEVIEAYMASAPDPGGDSLSEWVARYPQYARELMDFAAHWSLIETLPPHDGTDREAEEEALASRGRSMFQDVWQRERRELSEGNADERSLISLRTDAEKRGMDLDQLASAAELSPSIVEKLDQRSFEFTSIPQRAIENLARAVGRSFGAIALYLQGERRLSPTARHGLEATPKTGTDKEDFFEAVRRDESLSDERRRKWLGLAPRKE